MSNTAKGGNGMLAAMPRDVKRQGPACNHCGQVMVFNDASYVCRLSIMLCQCVCQRERVLVEVIVVS